MIKRKYFFSVKVAHNNNTGEYSWWSAILNAKAWVQNADELLLTVRKLAQEELQGKLSRQITPNDIEVIALNKL
ncbi:MAG: hypothetical protein GY787_29970 [Alteromonadales bacterium]|nr:hypothetical protein [Alteromonadales bacterium]